MKTRSFLSLSAISLAGLVALTGCTSTTAAADDAEANVIRVVTLPAGDDPTTVNPWVALEEFIETETGMEVEVTDAPDYLGVVEAVRAGHTDIALMSAFPSALAVNTGEVDALLTWPGTPEPVSMCYVLADSPIQKLEDLKGKTVGFADPGSSSGFFMPVHLLDSVGLERDVDYDAMFAGGHDRTALAVKEGQIDATCTSTSLTKMHGTDYFPFEEGEVRFIGESIPMDISLAVIASQTISDEKREALLKALPAIFTEKNADVLGVYGELGILSAEPTLSPSPDIFQSLVDVATVAGVDISDLD